MGCWIKGAENVGSLNTTGDAGGEMRAFFILVLFFLVFLLVAVNSMAGVDLTPNRPWPFLQQPRSHQRQRFPPLPLQCK
jgi:hypothetical protein